jgi:uncharacterized protein YecE (DUF72 family)
MGTFYTNPLPQTFTLKMKAGRSFEISVKKYRNITSHHIPEGSDFDKAREKAYSERYIAGELTEVVCEVREGIEVAQVREEL